MAVNADDLRDVSFTDFGPPKPRVGRPKGARVANVTKPVLRQAFENINVALFFAGKPTYQLDKDELDALTDAWYEVLKQYPSVGRYLMQGAKFSVWGNAFFVTYFIIQKRALLAQLERANAADSSGTTLYPNGRNGVGENDPGTTTPFVAPIHNSP